MTSAPSLPTTRRLSMTRYETWDQFIIRFWSHVQKTDSCWNWDRPNSIGYGRINWKRKELKSHRVAYELVKGPIPEGLHLDHLCRNPACVNPDHLEPVTCRVNTLRGVSMVAENARKTTCSKGHPFSGDNLYCTPGGKRACRTCNRENARIYDRNKRLQHRQGMEG